MARFSIRKKQKALPITQPRYVFEGLEPRFLLSADPFTAAVADSASLNPFANADPSEDEALAAFAALTRTDADTLLPSPETPVSLDLDSLAKLYASEDLDAVSPATEDGDEVRREVVIVDAATPDYQQLLNDLTGSGDSRSFEIVILQGDEDGVAQISDALTRYTDIDAVHIISHGTDAAVQLGDTWLHASTLTEYSNAITGWGDALTDRADLLFYGCDLAATADGQLLVEGIAGLTGADVAASDDLTGHADQGGDWDLEYRFGVIESATPFSAGLEQGWNGVLATVNTTATADTYIDKNLNSDNFGVSSSLVVDKSGGAIGDQRALLQFDLSTIPVGATITSAMLQMEATSNTGAFDINVYEVTASWVEGSGDGSADAANWNERQTGTNWGTAGGSFDPTVVATLNTASTGQHTWDLTSLVQEWYGGSKVNNGIIIGSPDGGGNTITYDSREGTTAPVLEISYLDTTLYLDGIGDGSDVPIANLKTTAPTDTTLDNFDPGRDTVTGLLLAKGGSGVNETDPVKYQLWVDTTAGTSLDGQARLTLWSAVKNFNTSNGASVTAYLVDSNADGSSVTPIASATISRADWDAADSGTWIKDSFDFGSVSYQLANDRYLGVKIIVDGTSTDDMWLAYDATANPSQLSFDVNEAPVIVTNSGISVPEEATRTITSAELETTDVDNTPAEIEYTLTGLPSGGSVRLNGSSLGLNDTFTQDDINNGRVSYRDADEGSSTSFQFTVSDGTSTTGNITFSVNGQPINDAPVVKAPSSSLSATEQVNLAIEGLGFSVTDSDEAGGGATATLSVGEGALTVSEGDSGVSISGGNGTGNVTLTGTIAQLDNLLTGTGTGTITYLNNLDAPSASTVMTVTVNDQGNTGTDPGLTGDAGSEEGINSQTINITAVNDAPVLAAIGNQSVAEGSTLSFTATATDADLPADTLSFSLDAASLALGMTIDANTGAFAWTPTESQGGLTPSVTVTVTDDGTGNLVDSETFTVTVNDTNTAPVLAAIGNQAVAEGSTLSFTATATDSDLPADTLTFSLDAASLALGMTIDANSGAFSWTPTESQGGLTPSVTVTVTDNGTGNLIDNETFQITVNDTNTAPVLAAIGNQSVAEGSTLSFTATATDADLPADTLSFSLDAASLALGMTIDANTGAFAWTSTESQGGLTPSVTVTVTDDGTGNLVDSETFTVTVNDLNTAPLITSDGSGATAFVNAAENQTAVTTVTSTDADLPVDTLTYTKSGGADQALFNLDPGTGVLTFASAPDFESFADANLDGVYEVEVQVSDGIDTDTQLISVTVTDGNEVPTAVALGNLTVAGNSDGAIVGNLTTTDPDSGDSYTYTVDDARFEVVAGQLKLKAGQTLDFETEPSVSLNVTSTDTGGLVISKGFTLTVTNTEVVPQFDPPTAEITNESLSTSNEIHIYSTASSESETADVADDPDEATENESETPPSNEDTDVGADVLLASLEGSDGAGVIVDDIRVQGDNAQKLDAAERKVLVRQLIEIFTREGEGNEDFSALFEEAGFLNGLNGLREDVAEDAFVERTMVGSSVAAATGLSVGYVVWLLRSGMLLSSVLSSMPAWRLVDPLPVLAYLSDNGDDDKDDDTLASLIAEHSEKAGPLQERQDKE